MRYVILGAAIGLFAAATLTIYVHANGIEAPGPPSPMERILGFVK
jgi:hypothetical protein